MKRVKADLELITGDESTRHNRINFFQLAYERLEASLISCELRPGRVLTMQDLQSLTGLGRTPVHNAVNRLAQDTLITIRPRHGLQIAPIDLARERVLLKLRRDLERFVIRLAAERSGPTHRNQMLHLERILREKHETLSIEGFNVIDRAIDKLILSAAGEPFLEHTLRPLHTIFRRIGYLYHTHLPGHGNLDKTVKHHLAVLNAVANHHIGKAEKATDALISYVDDMFDVMETEIDPSLLDCSLTPLMNV